MYIYKHLGEKLNTLKDIQYIILMSIISRSILYVFLPLANLYEEYIGPIGSTDILDLNNKLLVFIIVVIAGPILESYLIILIIKILNTKFKLNNRFNILLITTIIFSILHYYSVFYMFLVFIPGFIYVYSYMYYKPKRYSSFFIMTSIHSIFNLVGLIHIIFS